MAPISHRDCLGICGMFIGLGGGLSLSLALGFRLGSLGSCALLKLGICPDRGFEGLSIVAG